MLSSKNFCFSRSFAFSLFLIVLLGLFGCEESQNQEKTKDDASSEADSGVTPSPEPEDQILCTTYCSGTLYGPEDHGIRENEVEWEINLETLAPTGEGGPPVGMLLDSLTWQIEARTNGGWNMPSIKVYDQEAPPNECSPNVIKLGEPMFNEDSTMAVLSCYLTVSNEGCTLNVMDSGGSLVVIVAEGLPDKAGVVKILNVQGWKDDHPVVLDVQQRK